MLCLINVVEDAKAVVWTEANLPAGLESSGLPQGLAISRFDAWVALQLLVYGLADQGVILAVDRAQMLLDRRIGVHQGIGLPSRHDGHNYGHSRTKRQVRKREERRQMITEKEEYCWALTRKFRRRALYPTLCFGLQ
jgi:hypothetical protein